MCVAQASLAYCCTSLCNTRELHSSGINIAAAVVAAQGHCSMVAPGERLHSQGTRAIAALAEARDVLSDTVAHNSSSQLSTELPQH
jgi:hypothetical protein